MNAERSRVALMRAELERDWKAVQDRLRKAQSIDPRQGDAASALVALSLDHAYQAFETLLLRVDRALELPERSGPSWHVELLSDAALELDGVRPAIFPEEASPHWHALLRFRHFLRHAYAVDLDPDELQKNTTHLDRAVALTAARVQALLASLDTRVPGE